MLDSDAIVSHAPGVLAQRLDEEVVLLDPNLGHYFALNPTGARVWEWLESGGTSICELLDRLMRDYEVDRQRARDDLIDLVEELRSQKLVVVREASSQT